MVDGPVLTRRVSERGVHDWVQRAVSPASAGVVPHAEVRAGGCLLHERWWFSSPLAG